MTKRLGYTFYPKDWRSSMNVSKLTLQERGLYRELIDECFIQNTTKVTINCKTFARIYQLNSRSLTRLLAKLHESLLIVCPNFARTLPELEIVIPSVIDRLGVIDSASKGGKKSNRLGVKNVTKEKENINIKEKENIIEDKTIKVDKDIYKQFSHLSLSVVDLNKLLDLGFKLDQIDSTIEAIENYKKNTNYKSLYLTAKKWLENDKKNSKDKPSKGQQIIDSINNLMDKTNGIS